MECPGVDGVAFTYLTVPGRRCARSMAYAFFRLLRDRRGAGPRRDRDRSAAACRARRAESLRHVPCQFVSRAAPPSVEARGGGRRPHGGVQHPPLVGRGDRDRRERREARRKCASTSSLVIVQPPRARLRHDVGHVGVARASSLPRDSSVSARRSTARSSASVPAWSQSSRLGGGTSICAPSSVTLGRPSSSRRPW